MPPTAVDTEPADDENAPWWAPVKRWEKQWVTPRPGDLVATLRARPDSVHNSQPTVNVQIKKWVRVSKPPVSFEDDPIPLPKLVDTVQAEVMDVDEGSISAAGRPDAEMPDAEMPDAEMPESAGPCSSTEDTVASEVTGEENGAHEEGGKAEGPDEPREEDGEERERDTGGENFDGDAERNGEGAVAYDRAEESADATVSGPGESVDDATAEGSADETERTDEDISITEDNSTPVNIKDSRHGTEMGEELGASHSFAPPVTDLNERREQGM
ncbi:hypothetical protein BDK51DRAFT_27643 [Blyttiomyces helicus]|uniref:Uncharacterized protein n=1 Tax=Blyttiomyces helicus TaxID=388810 RepID=A0A4P9W1G2_9FUNG|nr:hypothetical protein BDK51DRAFT_27643 [Blyttiomyces helicus]|eukprot:RKO84410.1 hypothetical protein BDK51DRAFT_27643 [Blyttiomyces helicus]